MVPFFFGRSLRKHDMRRSQEASFNACELMIVRRNGFIECNYESLYGTGSREGVL